MTTTYLVFLLLAGGAKALIPPGEVGGECLHGKEPCLQSNSECIEGTCLCANFYRFLNGSCVTEDQSASLGKPCRGGGDCRGAGEFCSSFSVCMCLSTHVDVGSQCRPAVYPGQFGCEDSRQCNKGFPGAECDASRRCVCPLGMHAQQQTCVLPLASSNVILADDRFSSIRRSPSNFFSRRRYQQASAIPGGIPPDSICSVDADCSGYPLSYCDGVCRCVSGALNAGSTCISSGNALQPAGSCAAGQTYVTEAGACMTVQQPGEPCQYSQQCAAAEPGAFCLRLRCECVYGMKQSGTGCTFVDNQCTKRGFIWISELGECKEVLPPGGRGCSHSLQCTQAYPEASCFLQTCTCPINFPIPIDGTCGRNCSAGETYSGVTGQCLPTVKPGNQCLYSSQCHAINPGMICDRNRCRCPSGMVFSGTKCTQQCPVGFIVNSKGVCSPGCRINQVEFEGECLDQVAPGANCTVNAQCMGGASCQNGRCLCPKAMMPRGSICVFVESPPGGSCGDGQQCTGSSFCSNGNCTCPAGRQIINGMCVTPQTVDIGGACVRVGVACGGGSICVAGICVCPLGMSPWMNTCVEHRNAKPGESCSRGEECTGGSACDENSKKCACIQSTQMVIGNSCQERLRSHPGYPCTNGEMCVGGSICRDGRCACADGKIEINKICVERLTVGAGDTCGNGEICGGNSECDYSQKKCICKRGQQLINNQCIEVTVVPPGEVCSGPLVRCGGGAYCVRGRCECPNNQVPLAGKCVAQRQVPPGKSCTSAEVCMGRSVCRDGLCQCTSDMVLVGTSCEIRRKIRPTESCRMTDECLGGSKCNGHICECPAGQVLRDATCQPRLTKRPGLRCSLEDLCVGQSICVQGKCQCRPGEKPINGVCAKMPQVIPGGSCSENDECIGGSNCRGGVCMCPAGQTIVAHVCKTVVKAMPGNTCANGEVCDGGSFCHQPTKICRCQPGFMSVKGVCHPLSSRAVAPLPRPGITRPALQTLCRSNVDCLRGAICRGGICACPLHLVMRNGACVPPMGVDSRRRLGLLKEPCENDHQCAVLNSYCTPIGVCGCQQGFRIFGSTQCIHIHPVFKTSTTTTTTTTTTLPPTIQLPTTTEMVTPSIELRLPGTSCDMRSLCTQGSVCIDGRCRCPAGFNLVHNNCVRRRPNKIVAPLSSCAAGEVCGGGSECIYGLCFCTDERTLFRGECLTLSEIDKIREREVDAMSTKTSTRFQKILSTLPATTPSSTSTTTQTTTTTTSTARPTTTTTTTKKTTAFTRARPLIEIIPATTTPGTTRKPVFWFKVARPGFECDESTFCTNCSICVDGFCSCPEGLELIGEKCLSPIDARSCLASNQCPSGAECVGGECRCSPGLALSRFGFCMPLTYVDPGMSCKEGETCRGGSECRDGMCICGEGLFIRDNKCLPPVSDLRLRPPEERLRSCPSDGSCKLPDCFCSQSGTVPPGGLDPKKVPQMVILTFDDPITDRTINIYKSMFNGKFRNPNGCPIKGTFFVSHEFNNYDQTQWLHSRGNEIGLNSITHEKLNNATKERWRHEMAGLRDSLKAFSYVEASSVRGVRAPHLLIGGDNQFDMMAENGLLYDNSMTAQEGPVWPQTLDYQLAWDCGEQSCPLRAHKGLWSIPMQLISSNDGIWHSLARTAVKPYDTRETTHRLLQRNFYRNYNGNRAPFILNADSEFLTYLPDNGVVHAVEDWLKEILNNTDVYVVTASQAIEWMKRPISAEGASKFKPWQCNFRQNDQILPCENPSICSYDSRGPTGMPHSFRVCGSCPPTYPWISDPTGTKHLRV